MIRFMNLNTAFLALTLVFAYGTYHVKYDAQRAAKTLKAIDRDIEAESARERVLQADWSLLNEPTRLQKLATRHLALAPVEAKQVSTVAGLKDRLQVLTASSEPEPAADGRIITAAGLQSDTRAIVIRR
jgi:cell division protein FtsL